MVAPLLQFYKDKLLPQMLYRAAVWDCSNIILHLYTVYFHGYSLFQDMMLFHGYSEEAAVLFWLKVVYHMGSALGSLASDKMGSNSWAAKVSRIISKMGYFPADLHRSGYEAAREDIINCIS